jgi:HAMP domain-containing protein
MSIRLKVVLAVAACAVAAAAAVVPLVRYAYRSDMRLAAAQAVRGAGESYAALERQDVGKLAATLEALAVNPALAEAFAKRDRARLLALAGPLFERLRADHGITHFYFIEPEPGRTCFLRVHRPDLYGDVVDRQTLAEAIRTRSASSGKELGKTAFALRVVRPWIVDGKLLGYLELGEEIDHFIRRMKAQASDDFGMVVEKRHLDAAEWAATRARAGLRNNWGDKADVVVVEATTSDETIFDFDGSVDAIPDGGAVLETEEVRGRTLVRGVLPVADAAGHVVGALFVLHDVTSLRRSMQGVRLNVLALVVGLAFALSAVLLLMLNRLVFRRLDRMIDHMEDLSARLAGGDYEAGKEITASAADEIGEFETFFGRFLAAVGSTLSDLGKRSGKG